jgi:hypothetical protein
LTDGQLEFQIDGKKSFGIDYKDIALSNVNGNNEVMFEFAGDAE